MAKVITIATANFNAGDVLSSAVNASSLNPQYLIMPANWTPACISYQMSADNIYFADVFDSTGFEIMHNVQAGLAIPISATWATSAAYFKIRSGTQQYPVPQQQAVTIQIAME